MIKNIIFDIGGVLLEYNPKTYLDKIKIEESKRKELNNIIFHNQKWRDCLNGIITNDELIEYLSIENPIYKDEINKILNRNNLKYMLPPKIEMIEYYKTLKQKGYKIYLCSNITEDTYNYIKENFEIMQIADGGIFSCFENISKPNTEIYYNLINKYGIDVNETIFIDDTKSNIEIANKIGFKTILFTDIKQITCELMEKPVRKAVRCYLIKENEVMVTKYKEQNKKAGYYDIPGGKIEEGEAPQQTVIREMKEETGIEVTNPKYKGKMLIEYPNRIFDFDVFIARDYKGEPQDFEENTSEWIDITKLLQKEKILSCIMILDRFFIKGLIDEKCTFIMHIKVDEQENILNIKYSI